MEILTSRFGLLSVTDTDVLTFKHGLIGLEHCDRWVVLTDSKNPSLGWLQSLNEGHIALGVVSPRRFLPDYQLRVERESLAELQLATPRDAAVVVIVSRRDVGLTLNLRAPLVINVAGRCGCQVIAKDDLPVQFPLSLPSLPLKRTA